MIDNRFLSILTLLPALLIYGCADVKTVNPIRKNIIASVYASGEIVAENEHWLSAAKAGVLLKKYVKEGDTVTSGQLLYVIGDEARQAKIDAALANYKLSSINLSDSSPVLADIRLAAMTAKTKVVNDSANYWRWKNLWDRGIGTRNNLDNAHTQYKVSLNEKKIADQRYLSALGELNVTKKIAESQLADARRDFADSYILSDQSGVIYETLKDEGEMVSINEKLLLLGNCNGRTINLYVDQQDITRIKPGQKVLLQTDATGSKVFEATVTFIYPSMNKNDQTFCIEAKFNQPPPYSFVHSPVEANIIVEEKQDVLVLPKEVFAEKDSVWIKDKKSEKKIPVKTGIASFDYIEVVSGVDENTAVLVDWYKLK
jgi:HlyD family secretion protein